MMPPANQQALTTTRPALPLSVCIVSHNAYGAITGGKSGFIGGVEWQTSLLARWLAGRGHHVTLVTWNEGGASEECIDGVTILKLCAKDAGLPGVRFVYPRWSSLLTALRKADADIYYHNCGESVTGQIALWCRWNARPFVFSAASEADCNPALPELRTRRERVLYRWGLRHADLRLVQTSIQQRMMHTNFGAASEVMPMPCPGPSDNGYAGARCPAPRVLWLGRVCRVKRPDRLVEIARLCPDIRFDLAGPIYADDYARAVENNARKTPNITVHGPVARNRVSDLYRKASILCCTSEYEGFPNTFLEAWSYGIPVVSTVDPDGVISRFDLGVIGEAIEPLAQGIRTLVGSELLYTRKSAQCRQYYVTTHSIDTVMPRIERLFLKLAKREINPQQATLATA